LREALWLFAIDTGFIGTRPSFSSGYLHYIISGFKYPLKEGSKGGRRRDQKGVEGRIKRG